MIGHFGLTIAYFAYDFHTGDHGDFVVFLSLDYRPGLPLCIAGSVMILRNSSKASSGLSFPIGESFLGLAYSIKLALYGVLRSRFGRNRRYGLGAKTLLVEDNSEFIF
jgi:hypothetical protein